jgi:hypothetical protein
MIRGLVATLKYRPRQLLDEQRHSSGAFNDLGNGRRGQRLMDRNIPDHRARIGATQAIECEHVSSSSTPNGSREAGRET